MSNKDSEPIKIVTEEEEDLFDCLLDENVASSTEKGTSEPVSTEELARRMRERRTGKDRQRRIQQKKKKGQQSHPLQRIFFCDSRECMEIMDLSEAKICPACRVFVYCSPRCQKSDWNVGHKLMCGKSPTKEYLEKKDHYLQANECCAAIERKVQPGKYLTVLHEKENPNPPACMFTTIAEKSNLLNWREYVKTPIFTTSGLDTLGDFSKKVVAAQNLFPDKKIFLMSCILDRVREGQSTECTTRMYVTEDYGETMDAPVGKNGKITKTVTKYKRG